MEMRSKVDVFVLILSVTSFLFLCPLSYATKSRLMGMGDLSVVIEDESNMINLWDFARNPAGLLEDEKAPVVRADLFWDAYDIRNLRCGKPPLYYKCKADGGVFQVPTSTIFRREGNFALGLESNYFFRQTDFKDTKSQFTYPEICLVFSKSLNSLTSVGADLAYVEYTSETSYKEAQSMTRFKTTYFRAEIGAGRRLSSELTLGALLGYDSMDSGKKYYTSDFHTFWLSLHSIVEVEQRFRLGLETVFNLRRADFEHDFQGDQSYYFAYLRLRGLYDLTSSLRLGLFFSHNELFSGFYYPVETFLWPVSPDAFAVEHLGLGCSYKFNDNLLAGLEYHFRNSSEPDGNHPDWGFSHESLNLGLEGKLSRVFSVKGGYIRTEVNRNPETGWPGKANTWGNVFTLGFGYQPHEGNLIFDLSYRYAFKKFEQWHIGWDVESERHVLSLSFKKIF